jgi:glycosyltransferase involved in cell wall biosynthesis
MQPPWAVSPAQLFTNLPVHAWDLTRVRDFDIVHSHGCAGFKNWRIRAEAKRTRIVHSYYGTILGIQVALRWFQNLVGWNGFHVPRFIIREALGGLVADAVIANSPKVCSEIRRYYGVRNSKIFVIPGGYLRETDDTQKEFLRRMLGLPESGFLFLFVGRPDPVKNFHAALMAFQRTKALFPNSYLILAPKQDLKPTEGIVSVDLAPQKMNQLYRSVDVLIHPSHYEAYSLAVHEALANGLPVIVGRNTGNANYCTHRVNALILPRGRGPGLVHSISQMMCSLIESDGFRSALGKEASRKFGVMDWEWVATETERVYSSL